MAAVIAMIGSHPYRGTDHTLEDAVALFSADGVTMAVGACPVVKLKSQAGEETGVLFSAHDKTQCDCKG
jgi:hypothetical protein